jgi:DNA-binding CsgD family transcriptional regulator/nitrate/nitrite-specific signal transduction histidine kinase
MLLRVSVPRGLFQQGIKTRNYLLVSLICAGLIFFGLTVAFMERWVIVRLIRASDKALAVAQSGNSSERMVVEGKDELSVLCASINAMLQALEESRRSLALSNDALEHRVQERTRDLGKSNDALRDEIREKRRAEAALQQAHEKLEQLVLERTNELQQKTVHLEEMNAALRVLLKQREEDKLETEEAVLANVQHLLLPSLEKLKRSPLNGEQGNWLATLESHIQKLTAPFVRRLNQNFLTLTPTEIKVAELIKAGRSTKEIADILCLSESTILFHRHNLRDKLGLKGKRINLMSYLGTLE